MIAVLIDKKGFTKSQEIPYPVPDIQIPIFEQPKFWPEPEDKNVFDRQTIQFNKIKFYREKELYPQVWLYVEK